MSSKRQRGEGSSSVPSKSFDKKRFISLEAAEKYKAWESRTFIPERGFLPSPSHDGELAQMIAERGWFDLTAHPEEASDPIVREVYANAHEKHFDEIYVRGKTVSFMGPAINNHYHLTDYDSSLDEHAQFALQPDYDLLIQQLCKPGTKWSVKGRGAMTFPQSELSPFGRAWYAFICARLMPTNHFTHVTKERAVLLYSIVTGKKINVGVVIKSFMMRYVRGGATSAGFPFPQLISAMCSNAGVQWAETLAVVQPWPIIDHAVIKRYKGWSGAAQNQRGLGYIVTQQNVEEPSNNQVYRQLRRLQSQIDARHEELLQENNCLAERQEALFMNFNQFQTSLAEMLGRIHPDAGPFNFPDPHPLPVFPPVDSNDENAEAEDDD